MLLVFTSVMTVVTTNPIESLFWLVLSFLIGAALLISLLISLRLDFIPLVLIIVYVGAIVILFLFVVMMLEVIQHNRSPVYNVMPIMIVFSATIFIRSKIKIMGQSIFYEGLTFNLNDHLHIIGVIVYMTYIFPFITVTIFAFNGAIMLGLG